MEAVLGILNGSHLAHITPLNRSDSHSIHPNVVKAPSTTWVCSILLSSSGVHPVPGCAWHEELFQVLHKYHVEITKTAGASGRPARKTFRRAFGSDAVSAEEASKAGGDAPSTDPPAAPAAGPRRPRPRRPRLRPRQLLQGEGVETRNRDDVNECFD
jgi:hypothetical protein